jgi:hypothetical protein
MEPNQMQTQTVQQMHPKTSAKDFVLNLGTIVALFTVVINLINLLFTVINKAFPQITNGYNYSLYASQSISFPVATLIIFFPIYVLLMWILARGYRVEPEKKQIAVRKWLTYLTLFIAGLTLAGDLVTVLYYFIDGQELTAGFLMKVFVVFVITLIVFLYYISDIRNRLTGMSQKIWTGAAVVVILASIVWGFAILGSPRTQQLMKYDQQKIGDLQNINSQVYNYYQTKGGLPGSLADISGFNTYSVVPVDQQTGKPYEYILVGQSAKAYQLCATFNKSSANNGQTNSVIQSYPYDGTLSWSHPAGRYCFTETIPVNQYPVVPKTIKVL